MKRICTQLFLIILSAISVYGQLELSFNSASVTSAGQDVDIDIVVEDGFDDLVSIQFSINWDATAFSYVSIENVTDALPMFNETFNLGTPPSAAAVSDGQLTFSWSGPGTSPFSLDDNTRLFTLRLSSVGAICDGTTLVSSNIPRVIEVVNNNLDILDLVTRGGNLIIDDGNCSNMGMDGVGLLIDDVSSPAGSQLCIPIRATSFMGIESVQFGIQWDPEVLSYNEEMGVNGVGISPIRVTSAGIDQGRLNALWIFDRAPVTVADNDVLFEVCFDVIGETGESTQISIVDFPDFTPPFAIEISSDNGFLDFFTDNATFSVGSGDGRNGVGFIVDSIYTGNATSICVPILTENFDSLVAFMTGVSFNSSVLTYTGFNMTGLTSNVNVADQNSASGELSILWFDQNATGISLDNGSSLLEMCFDVIGSEGETSPIGFINVPPDFRIEAVKLPDEQTQFFIDDGVVIVGSEPEQVDPIVISASDEMFDINDTVCVDFYVENFEDIGGMSFVLSWDESVLQYVGPRNTNLQGLEVGQSNFVFVDPNALRVLYTPTSPQSVADSTIIFQVCYVALAACDSGVSTEISFGSDSNISLEFINADSEVIPVSTNAATITARSCEMVDPLIELVTLTNPSCPGNSDGAIIVDILNLTGSLNCTWTDVNGDAITNNCNLVGQTAGEYTLTVVDELDVSVAETFTLTDPSIVGVVSVEELIKPTAGGTEGEIRVTFMGGAGDYMITTSSVGQANETNIAGLPAGSVTYMVVDAEGCEYMFTYVLEPEVVMTSTACEIVRAIISPNGDGMNEEFIIGCLNDPDVASQVNDLSIYNRWGDLVFSDSNYDNSWTGNHTDGTQLDEGGYMWVFTIGPPTDRQIFRGTLTLLR